MNEQKAVRIIIRVDGFHDAKHMMYRMLREGVATCSSCDKPATHIFWQDRAEWYFECDEHYTDQPMWTGSTDWKPRKLSKRIIPDAAHAWVESWSAEECHRRQPVFEQYDATDYYALLRDDLDCEEVALNAGGYLNAGTVAKLYPLIDGRYAYEISFRSPGHEHNFGLVAPFYNRESALDAARLDAEVRA